MKFSGQQVILNYHYATIYIYNLKR